MKFYPFLVFVSFNFRLLAQQPNWKPSFSGMHYAAQCINSQAIGTPFQLPAMQLDSFPLHILMNGSINEFDPSIQNQSLGLLGQISGLHFKLGIAQFGNSNFKQQSCVAGLQLKLLDKLKVGTELQFAQSTIVDYKSISIIGASIGIAVKLMPAILYANKLGLFVNESAQNELNFSHDFLHVLTVKVHDNLNLHACFQKHLEQNNANFAIAYQLQFKKGFSQSMSFAPEQKMGAIALLLPIQLLQLIIELKYNQALGVSYFMALSKPIFSHERKRQHE